MGYGRPNIYQLLLVSSLILAFVVFGNVWDDSIPVPSQKGGLVTSTYTPTPSRTPTTTPTHTPTATATPNGEPILLGASFVSEGGAEATAEVVLREANPNDPDFEIVRQRIIFNGPTLTDTLKTVVDRAVATDGLAIVTFWAHFNGVTSWSNDCSAGAGPESYQTLINSIITTIGPNADRIALQAEGEFDLCGEPGIVAQRNAMLWNSVEAQNPDITVVSPAPAANDYMEGDGPPGHTGGGIVSFAAARQYYATLVREGCVENACADVIAHHFYKDEWSDWDDIGEQINAYNDLREEFWGPEINQRIWVTEFGANKDPFPHTELTQAATLLEVLQDMIPLNIEVAIIYSGINRPGQNFGITKVNAQGTRVPVLAVATLEALQ